MTSVAANPDEALLTLERVFSDPPLVGASVRQPRFSPDGSLVTVLRNRADDRGRFDLWTVDPATGATSMLFVSDSLGPGSPPCELALMQLERARLGGARGVLSYQWSADGRSLLAAVDGDWVRIGRDGGAARLDALGNDAIDATLSPDGASISYVAGGALHVLRLDDAVPPRRLAEPGGEAESWGLAEFVAQEEMRRRRGHWWSPDSRMLAVAQVDESAVERVVRPAMGSDHWRLFAQRYPRAGTPNARVSLWIMAADGSGRVAVDLGEDPDIYLARVDWLPQPRGLLVQRQTRDQKRLDLLVADPATGRTELLFSETSETWVNLSDSYRLLGDGGLIWSSERDGYRHLYLWADGAMRQLTHGNWAVAELAGIDSASGTLFFTGFADGVLEKHLYALDFRAVGAEPRRLTEPGAWHDAVMDGAGRRAILIASAPGRPPQCWLAGADGARLAWIEENRLDETHPWHPFSAGAATPVFGTIKAGDGTTDLEYWLLLPPGLKPGEKAPVLLEVYGGPGTQRVMRNFVDPRSDYFARAGWIVFMLDNRGAANRGKAFEEVLYRRHGDAEVEDQLLGVEWLKAQPFVDPDRIVLLGWSYGGFLTLKLLQAAPGVFAGGASGGVVTDWRRYDTHYTERYLGDPAADPAPYDRACVLDDALGIIDPLLLIHGTADDNVLFGNPAALIARLQDAGRPFETMIYPGKPHQIRGARSAFHLQKTIEAFLCRAIGGGPRPAPE